MFIQTEETANPDVLRFLPGRPVLESGSMSFPDATAAARSPLAERLFRIDHVTGVLLAADWIEISKADSTSWHLLKPPVLAAIMEHFMAGLPLLRPDADLAMSAEMREIQDLIETRIRPGMREEGGDVVLHGFDNGTASLRISGGPLRLPLFALQVRIENTFRALLPDVEVAFVDLPRENQAAGVALDTPEAQAIQALLDEKINPAIAAHGGYISLIDIDDATAFVRLEGGCQGCGLADVTLKQGVESAILSEVPTIGRVVDVTDHAGGDNPYYQPSK